MKRILSLALTVLILMSLPCVSVSAATWTTHAYARFLSNGTPFDSGRYYYDQTYSYTVSTGSNAYIPCKITAPSPSRTGYDFRGWVQFSNKSQFDSFTYNGLINGTTEVFPNSSTLYQRNSTVYLGSNPLTTSSDPMIFVASWARKTYTITYVFNNGSSNRTDKKTYGYSYSISNAYTPKREGYTFKGWSKSSDALTVDYQPGDVYTQNEALSLYAVWEKDTYTVTYDANGGVNAPDTQYTTVDDGMRIPEQSPYRDSYIFNGWAESADSEEADYMPGDLLPCKNLELHALWIPELPEKGLAIYGKSSSEFGNEIYEDVYLSIDQGATYLNIDIEYPSFINYSRFEQTAGSDEIIIYENDKGNNHVLNLSSYNAEGLDLDGYVHLGRIYFDLIDYDSYSFGKYTVSFLRNNCYLIVNGAKEKFTYFSDQVLEILAYKAKKIEIDGSDSICKPTQYTVVFTPDKTTEKSIEWSVDDETIASVDQNGLLTPYKNGTVTLSAKTKDGSDLTATYQVTVTQQPALLDSLSFSEGRLSEKFDPKVFQYTLYLPTECESLEITADFSEGTLLCDSYGNMIPGISKTVFINPDTKQLTLTKITDDYDDADYIFRIEKVDNIYESLGDVDGDNMVTILDATAIQRHLANLPTQSFNASAADVDGDNMVTILDATAIQQYLANQPTQKQ